MPSLPDRQRAVLTLDTSGLACPLPVLKARKALLQMPAGERLELLATDPLAAIDVPNFCREAGHHLVDSDARGPLLRFMIERGNGGSGGAG